MLEKEVAGFTGVPSIFAILLNISTLTKMEFKTLRYVIQVRCAIAPSLQEKVTEPFSPYQLYIIYSATEASLQKKYSSAGG